MESIINRRWTPFNRIPNSILALFMDPPEDFLYVGTDEGLRNRLQQPEHKMRRIDLSPYAEQGYQVRIAFWYLDTPEREKAEAFLIHTLHPRHNIDYPALRGPWNLQTPDDEDIDPETVRTGTRYARVKDCRIDNKPGVYVWYVRF